MENLTKIEKMTVQRLLSDEFHKHEPVYVHEKSKCEGIIDISKKLKLNPEFIEELENCFDLEFK